MSVPVYDEYSTLRGVIGIDISLSDLLAPATYFSGQTHAYTFVIDPNGLTLQHPLIPNPTAISIDPIFVDITHLEEQDGVASILDSMKR